MEWTGALPSTLPEPTPTSAPFWEALGRGELRLQHCAHCGAWVHYPRARCVACWSEALEWERVEPRGIVYAFTVAERPTAPMYAAEVPQVIAVVELDVGARLTTTLVVDDPDTVRVGMAVQGVFERARDGVTLLRFAPAS